MTLDNQNNLDNIISENFHRIISNSDIYHHSIYQSLLKAYEENNWEEGYKLLEKLIQLYPEEEILPDFRSDIEIQQILHEFYILRRKKKRAQFFRTTITSIIMLVIVVVLGLRMIGLLETTEKNQQEDIIARQEANQSEALQSLEDQALALLDGGNYALAKSIIIKLEEMDPDYFGLSGLYSRANRLEELENIYQLGIEEFDAGNFSEALEIFIGLDKDSPLYRDVSKKIDEIEAEMHVQELLKEGNTAYEAGQWGDVINSYEQLLVYNSDEVDDKFIERLLAAYIADILSLLDQEDSEVEEIQRAEQYYKSAISLIPQSKQFESEREEFDSLILNLLIFKYSQAGRDVFAQNMFSEVSVSQSISFLKSAYRLNPDNSSTENDLENLEIYLSALRNFNDQDYKSSLNLLTKINDKGDIFGEDGLGFLLYETRMALGRQKASYGLFADARNHYNEAEFIAWDQRKNDDYTMQIFEVQINLAYALGRLQQYEEAVSYYEYAIKEMPSYLEFSSNSDIAKQFRDAAQFSEQGLNYKAYEVYRIAFTEIQSIYEGKLLVVEKGTSIATIAYENQSTINSIIEVNHFSNSLSTTTKDTELLVPVFLYTFE